MISVMLSIPKLMDQFSRCWASHTYLAECEEMPCVCVCVFVVSVYVLKCPTPSIFKPMGQSLSAKGVEVQFVDCKINVRALLASHSAWRFPKCWFLKDGHAVQQNCLILQLFLPSPVLLSTPSVEGILSFRAMCSIYIWMPWKTSQHVQTCSLKW